MSSDVVNVIVSLTPRSVARVEKLAAAHDDTKSNTINRAIALFAALDDIQDDGGSLFVQRANGQIDKLKVTR